MSHLTDHQGTEITKSDVKQALDTVLRSPGFVSSPQLSDFLRYIVEKTLEGNANDIKAYSIAVDALGKSEDYDPQENAAVRVAAGRLRQTLALHNAGLQPNESSVMITLEAGSYVPIFVRPDTAKTGVPTDDTGFSHDGDSDQADQPGDRSHPPASAVAGREKTAFGLHIPTLIAALVLALIVSFATASYFLWRQSAPSAETQLVTLPAPPKSADRKLRPGIAATLLLPDTTYPDWFPVGTVADSLTLTLARFDSYEFYGVTVAKEFVASSTFDADFTILMSAYNRGNNIRMFAQLIRGSDGVVLWSAQRLFSKPLEDQQSDVPSLMGRLMAPLLSPYGVIYNDLRSGGDKRFGMRCFIAAYQYFYSETDKKHSAARKCAENLRDNGSRLPGLHAALTFLYLDEYREGRNRLDRDPLEAANRMAKRAVQLGPLSARAHQAAFAVQKVQGMHEMARASGQRAIELNPYDTDIMSDYAAWLISIGDAETGRKLLEDAVSLLQSRPAWVDFYRFLGAELTRDLDRAAEISALLDLKRSPLLAVAVAIGAHRRGQSQEARLAIEELRRVAPKIAKDPKEAFLLLGFHENVAQSLNDKLVAAGLLTNFKLQN